MNSQNTPVHIRLWHRDFWLLSLTNFLLATAVYMLLPTMPEWLMGKQGLSPLLSGVAMGIFGLGLFLFGGVVSYLVERYRRNIVCIWSIAAMAGLIFLLYYIDTDANRCCGAQLILLHRFLLGATFGLAEMVLASTLIIDASESYQRTEANHSAAWFERFALSIGPLAGLIVNHLLGFDHVLLGAVGCLLVSVLFVFLVKFPFRAPADEIRPVCFDRFFLPQGFPLFVSLEIISLSVGILFSAIHSELFYGMMMVGFFMAILAQRFAFPDAELKSEVISGLIVMAAALLMMITRTQQIVAYAAPVFVGFGIGIVGSRFLLFFIKLSRHCQRGTSQSTFMLGWESGIAIGYGIGLAFCFGSPKTALCVSLALTLLSLFLYHFVHNWFTQHKNR